MVTRHSAPVPSFTQVILYYRMTKNVISTNVYVQNNVSNVFLSLTTMNLIWGQIWGVICLFHSIIPQNTRKALNRKDDPECLVT